MVINYWARRFILFAVGLEIVGIGCMKESAEFVKNGLVMRAALPAHLGSSSIRDQVEALPPNHSNRPCPYHTGQPRPWEGSGLCTRNNILSLPLITVGLSLIYNSKTDWQFGYGAGLSLGADLRIYEFADSVTSKPFLLLGDGTVVTLKRMAPAHGNTFWTAADSTQIWLNIAFPDENTLNATLDDGTILTFSKLGSKVFGLVAAEDRFKRKTGFARDSDGTISRITLFNGKSISFLRTGNKITEILGTNNESYGFIYDGPRLTKLTNPDGTYFELSYFSGNKITALKTPDGVLIQFTYDSGLLSTIYNGNYLTSLSASNGSLTITESGNTTVETYQNGMITKLTANGITSTYDWKDLGNSFGIKTYKDHFGNTTTFTYSGQNRRPTQITFPKLAATDVLRKLEFQYDNKFNLTSSTKTDGRIITITKYDPDNFGAISQVNVNGKITAYQLTKGFLTQITAPNGAIVYSALYDGPYLKSETDADGHTTTYTYTDGLITKITDGYGRDTSLTYNPYENISSSENKESRLTQEYDVMGLPVGVTRLKNSTTGSAIIYETTLSRWPKGIPQSVTSTYQVVGKTLSLRNTNYGNSTPLRKTADQWTGPRGSAVNLLE